MAMPERLAWFTPLPPERSGIAAYSAELLPQLASRYAIDVYAAAPLPDPIGGVALHDAHDFVWKHQQQPYDLTVYQLGNAVCHDYIWPYLFRHPGLVVLHDGQLHHARARLLLQQERHADYRAEFRYNHPDARPELADLGITGLLGPLHYFWPMLRTVVDAARMVAAHGHGLTAALGDEFPEARIAALSMGVPAVTPRSNRSAVLARHGVPPEAIVFAAFGRVTPEKRVTQILRAMAAIGETDPPIHLLLVGEPASYYDATTEAESLGVASRVTTTGFVADDALADYLGCADVCLCLRWPSARETSASWLRCLAAGKPTIVTDLAHTVDTPSLDPRLWQPLHAPTANDHGDGADPVEPICVSIDILDEDHSLRLAMRRLAEDAALRANLGRRALACWQRRHTLDRMVGDYAALIRRALDCASPSPTLPSHLVPDSLGHARALAEEGGYAGNPLDREM